MPATPLKELSSYKRKQAAMKAVLDVLYDVGGYVGAEKVVVEDGKDRRGGSKNATTIITEMVDESLRANSADTFNKLRAGGWIEAPVNGKRVAYVKMAAGLPWKNPRWPEETPTSAPTSETETAGPSADLVVQPFTISDPAPEVNGEADELGMRPGRLAARIEAKIPGLVEQAVTNTLTELATTVMGSLGFYATITPEQLTEMQETLAANDMVVSKLRQTIEDLNNENQQIGVWFDYVSEQEDQRLLKTNDGQVAGKSLTVNKLHDAYKKIGRTAIEAGWTIRHTRGGHLLWRSPEGKAVFSPSTPSTMMSATNMMRRKLRRQGLVIEGRAQEQADVDHTGGWNQT